jgi:ribosome-associated protein
MDSNVQPQSSEGRRAPLSADEKSTRTQSNAMLDLVLTCLDDDKAEEIVSISLEGKSAIADHMVVASGRSQRHVGALADHLTRRMKEEGFGSARVEGLTQSDWVLIDGGDVIIHIFRPEVREFYKLEKMWSADVAAERIAIS